MRLKLLYTLSLLLCLSTFASFNECAARHCHPDCPGATGETSKKVLPVAQLETAPAETAPPAAPPLATSLPILRLLSI